jgi:hypothetical protein
MNPIQPQQQQGGGKMIQEPIQQGFDTSTGQQISSDIQPQTSQPAQMDDGKMQELLDMINQIRSSLGSFNATNFASNNKTDKLRRDILRQVFEKLQMAGVDLTDQKSVSDFIENLRNENPELASMFEQAMSVLLGDSSGEQNVPMDPTASMDLGTGQQNNMNNDISTNEPNQQRI